jgi:hypothetical protein
MALGIELPVRDLGPAVINWDPDGVDIDLYPTNGTIQFNSDTTGQMRDVFEDGHGDAPVDKVYGGRVVTITADLTRQTLAQLALTVPGSTTAATRLEVPNKSGCATYDDAVSCIIKPLCDGDVISVVTTEWIYIWKATITENWELAYNKDDQRIVPCTIHVFPDDASGNVGELYRIGPA